MTVYGYARVSTPEQNTQDQRGQLIDAGCKAIFEDIASGARASRPGLKALLAAVSEGDTVTVVRLDRLGRSMLHTMELIERFRENGVSFRSLSDGVDGNTSAGRLMIGLLASISEYERALIQERTQAGLRTARAKGRVGGRPKALTGAKLVKLEDMLDRGFTAPEISKVMGVSRSTAYEYVRQVRQGQDAGVQK